MTARFELCITIGATPDAVWTHLEDLETHSEWMQDAVWVRYRGSQRAGVGTELDCLTKVGPFKTHDVMRVTEWKPGSVMEIDHRGAVTGTGRFELHPVAGGLTEFCWTERLRFPLSLGGLAGEQASRPVLRRVWRGNLERLRAQIEAREEES
jgi:uncharacterized protein YndB with AHSA1/START domain